MTAADIVGGVDAATGAETGLEVVRQVYPKLGMTPGILTAPRFSANATVSAALQAKTKEINGVSSACASRTWTAATSPTHPGRLERNARFQLDSQNQIGAQVGRDVNHTDGTIEYFIEVNGDFGNGLVA